MSVSRCAVEAIARWWGSEGRRRYRGAAKLLILADGGGSNGYRPRRWKWGLQVLLADAFGLAVTVCHFPPGASKWSTCQWVDQPNTYRPPKGALKSAFVSGLKPNQHGTTDSLTLPTKRERAMKTSKFGWRS